MRRDTKTTKSNRSRARNAAKVAAPVGVIALLSAGCLEGGLLPLLLQLFMVFLGASPSANFANNGQVELASVPMSAVGQSAAKGATDDKEYEVTVEEPAGTKAEVIENETTPDYDFGQFTILLDGSGSMERTDDECPDCPYDPSRLRVDATKILAETLLKESPESRLGIFEFTAGSLDAPDNIGCTVATETNGFSHTRVLQNYTSDVDALTKNADAANSCGGTYLYDSLNETLDSMDSDIKANFQASAIGKAVIVVTDGEDTSSENASLTSIISKANSLEIPIHVIGLGEASEFGKNYNVAVSNTALIKNLRALASETGGIYASAGSPDELTQLAETIAVGLTGSIEKTTVEMDPVPESGTVVKGKIRVKNADGSLGEETSYSFVAP